VREAWIWGGLVAAVAFVAAGIGSIVGDVAYQKIPTRVRDFTAPVRAVRIDIASGSVTVDRHAGSTAIVHSSGTRGLSFPTDRESVADGTLVIRSRCRAVIFNGNCTRNYVVQVDPSVSLAITTGQGDVTVDALAGPLVVNTGEGAVTLRRASGTVRATTGEGDISATDLRAPSADVRSGEGDIDLAYAGVPQRIVASSSQGDITVGVPRGPSYRIDAGSGQGNVSTRVAQNFGSTHVVRASSGEGDITIRYDNG